MEEFPGNANKKKDEAKKPEKKVERVISTKVLQRNRSLGSRFKEVFVGGEFKSATKYIAVEVLLPALRNMVVDATTKGIERVIYGDSAPRRNFQSGNGRPRVSYNSPVDRYSSPRRAMLPDQPPGGGKPRQVVRDIVLSSREDAELVLERLVDIIDNYEVASLADLNELVGLPSTDVDNKWGWSDLRYVQIRQVREGYLLDLPSVEPI